MKSAGFDKPTVIQALAMGKLLSGARMEPASHGDGSAEANFPFAKVVASETGSGKTLTYLCPVVTDLLEDSQRRSLVLCPNQMLCEQVLRAAEALPVHPAVLTAKVAPKADLGLPDPNLLIATPASLLKHVNAYLDRGKQRSLVQSLQSIVVDEADLLLSGGYDDALRQVLSLLVYGSLEKKGRGIHQFHRKDLGRYMNKVFWKLASSRAGSSAETGSEPIQFIFVAATMPHREEKSAGSIIRKAFEDNSEWIGAPRLHHGVEMAEFEWVPLPPEAVSETGAEAGAEDLRNRAVVELLRSGPESGRATLVFCNTTRSADQLTECLNAAGLEAAAYHKGVSAADREALMARINKQPEADDEKEDAVTLAEGSHLYIVSTGMAARGVDIPGLEHVVQAEFAQSAIEFLHRAGRTARAGQGGRVTSVFLEGSPEEDLVRAVRTSIESEEPLEDCFSRRRSFRKRLKRSEEEEGGCSGKTMR
jgi:superfamily II DNA/RNA helicase